MKKQIAIYNRNNTKLTAIIDTNDISGITEIEVAPKQLFDADGNVVSEEPGERRFVLALTNGKTTPFAIDEPTFNDLSAELLK